MQNHTWSWPHLWPPKPGASDVEALPAFVQAYYDQLKSDYESSGIAVQQPIGANPRWDDLYRMETGLLRARDEDEIRRSAWVVRMRFRNVAGDATYQLYLNSNPPDPAVAPRDLLLADLLNLVRRTYYLLALSPASEEIRQKLLRWSVFAGVVVVALIVLVILYAHKVPTFSVFALTMLAGAAGGTMSLIQRVQALPEADPLLFRLSGSTTVFQTVVFPPLAGAIFAGVLYMIFAAQLLNGSVFPSLYNATSKDGGVSFQTFFDATVPVSGKDFALVLVWAFIAGFAERFVPDTINRLTAQRTGEAKSGSTQ